jgi:hypothetical protein
MMAHRTISLQPPGIQTQQRQFQEKKHKAADMDSQKLTRFMPTARLLRAHAPSFECHSRGESTMDHMR